MNPDESAQARVTYWAGGDSQPSWSPDVRKLAWRSSPVASPEIGDIWVMNADRSSPTQLTDDPPTTSVDVVTVRHEIALRSLCIPNGDI